MRVLPTEVAQHGVGEGLAVRAGGDVALPEASGVVGHAPERGGKVAVWECFGRNGHASCPRPNGPPTAHLSWLSWHFPVSPPTLTALPPSIPLFFNNLGKCRDTRTEYWPVGVTHDNYWGCVASPL